MLSPRRTVDDTAASPDCAGSSTVAASRASFMAVLARTIGARMRCRWAELHAPWALLCVGLDVLHNDDALPVWALRDRVPDGQAVRRETEAVGTWLSAGLLRERVGKRRDWFFEQVKDRPVGGVPKWLRQSFELVPDSVREAEDRVTH